MLLFLKVKVQLYYPSLITFTILFLYVDCTHAQGYIIIINSKNVFLIFQSLTQESHLISMEYNNNYPCTHTHLNSIT